MRNPPFSDIAGPSLPSRSANRLVAFIVGCLGLVQQVTVTGAGAAKASVAAIILWWGAVGSKLSRFATPRRLGGEIWQCGPPQPRRSC